MVNDKESDIGPDVFEEVDFKVKCCVDELYGLTLGRWYDVVEIQVSSGWYHLVDDTGDGDWYPPNYFIDVCKIRSEKIEKILNGR